MSSPLGSKADSKEQRNARARDPPAHQAAGAAREDVEQALDQLKMRPLLDGYRGKPAADVAATVDAILGIQQFALAYSEQLLELDVNPLLLRKAGKGVCAADALIVVSEDQS